RQHRGNRTGFRVYGLCRYGTRARLEEPRAQTACAADINEPRRTSAGRISVATRDAHADRARLYGLAWPVHAGFHRTVRSGQRRTVRSGTAALHAIFIERICGAAVHRPLRRSDDAHDARVGELGERTRSPAGERRVSAAVALGYGTQAV